MEYKDLHLYKEIYANNKNYGNTGHKYVDEIANYIRTNKCSKILDFGCGVGLLKKHLLERAIEIDEYDPAIKEKSIIYKNNYDLIITTDVLEHLYENEIEFVIKEMLLLNPKFMLHIISTRKAISVLPDGTNAHKTIKQGNWWRDVIKKYTNFQVKLYEKPNSITKLECKAIH